MTIKLTAAHKLDFDALTDAKVTGQPIVIVYYHNRMGMYIPCSFDEDGNPDWQKIKDTIRAQEYPLPRKENKQ